MPFINNILKYNSIAVVGLEKNTGKTECLNYILSKIHDRCSCAVTSIGIDGESSDVLFKTHKPEITIYNDMFFITTEKHYRQKKITSEIVDILNYSSSFMGRLVVARAVNTGKTLLSGPPDTANLKRLITQMNTAHNCDLTIVDGALSRLSLGAPAITDAMILSTGAAVSANIPELVRKTKYTCDLISLPKYDNDIAINLKFIKSGVFSIDNDNIIHDLKVNSVFSVDFHSADFFKYGYTFFISGAVSDKIIDKFKTQPFADKITIIIRDFTKVFLTPNVFYSFIKKGGKILVLDKPNLIAITINPWSPSGYVLNSDNLRDELQSEIDVPIFDIKKL